MKTPPNRFLIADVSALTGVPPSQLRSWEHAGLLYPQRAAGAVRVYGVEDVARVRLVARSRVNPGRRGSLRRLAARLDRGEVRPEPRDYAGLGVAASADASATGAWEGSPPGLGDARWRAVVDAMADLVAVCDEDGELAYTNPALRAVLPPRHETEPALELRAGAGGDRRPGSFFGEGDLSLRWTARTGVPQQDVPVVLRRPDGTDCHTRWHAAPLRGADGALQGAVAVGRDVTADRPRAGAEDDWLAAAQDLRAPVTAILGHLQLARRMVAAARHTPDRPGGAAESPIGGVAVGAALPRLGRHLELAETSTHELLRALETLLDASDAATGGLVRHLDPADVDLGDLAQRAVAQARALTTRHVVTLERPPTPLVVAGDRARLRQVLDTLLANAVKGAPDGGPIDVRLEIAPALPVTRAPRGEDATRRWALLRVEDAGAGIPAAALPQVFDRDRRAEGVARVVQGTGLGLYACRAIVAAHGGHIWVERTATAAEPAGADPGPEEHGAGWHGTVMTVVLPLPWPAEPAGRGSSGAAAATVAPEGGS